MRDFDTVVIHGMFNPYLVLGLLFRPKVVLRTAWCIWGGDLYFFRFLLSPSDYLFEGIRRILIPRLPYVVTFLEGDLYVARKVYGFRGRHLDAFYPNPLDHDQLPSPTADTPGAPKTFLVGNSGAPTNSHIDAFNKIAVFADQSIEVICPLSYGGSEDYVTEVIAYGQRLFGDRFKPITEIMAPDAYAEVLRGIDIVVMNHNRQQALGNIFALIAMGKPIYLRSDTSTYAYFDGRGIEVWDVEDLSRTAFQALPTSSQARADRGRDFIVGTFSEHRAVEQWTEVFRVVGGQED